MSACVCVCGGVCALRWAEHKEIYLWDLFYWLVFKVARLWAAFPLFENMLLLAVSQRCIHLCRRLNYNPLIHLKSERSSGMLRRDNCQASLQTPSAPSTPQGEREGEGERKGGWTSVCSQTEPGVAEEEEGIICGTTLRAEPSATALLLPDHNQMCQVCPNRNDCVKAIFSNLSDFRVAPFPTRLPPPTPSICPMPPERQIQMLEEHNNHFQTGCHECSLYSSPPAQSCDERYTVQRQNTRGARQGL